MGFWCVFLPQDFNRKNIDLPSLKLTASLHLKMDGWNTGFLLGWPIFRGELSVPRRVMFSIDFPFWVKNTPPIREIPLVILYERRALRWASVNPYIYIYRDWKVVLLPHILKSEDTETPLNSPKPVLNQIRDNIIVSFQVAFIFGWSNLRKSSKQKTTQPNPVVSNPHL